MTEEQQAAYIMGLSAVLMATVFGMHAENMQRQLRGESMAYDEAAFADAIDKSGVHHNATIGLFHDLT